MKSSIRPMILGAAIGAGVMYLLDPRVGRRRRSLIRDQVVHARHELADAARSGARHARNRMAGLAHELRAGFTEDSVDDRVLEERVRSAIGRAHPLGAVEVHAHSGEVTISGRLAPTEAEQALEAAKSVRGVQRVQHRFAHLAHD